MDIVIEKSEIKLLAEVGMLAATRGDLAAARAIFSAVEQERPECAAAYAGPAVALLVRGRPDEAIEGLQRGLALVPPEAQSDLQAFLGVAFHLDGRTAESLRALGAAKEHPLAAALTASSPIASQGA